LVINDGKIHKFCSMCSAVACHSTTHATKFMNFTIIYNQVLTFIFVILKLLTYFQTNHTR